ncbi:MAG: hypothetical protein IJD86_08525 [Clostridia bacterium]|nr:hypothetical protein [Clostridia bacterium]
MRKLRAILRWLTELAVLPEAYREDLRSTLNFDDDGMRHYGEYHACLLLSELEKCGLNLVFVNCYLHKRYEAKQFREMHLFLMMLFACIGATPTHQFVEIGHFDDLLEIFMDEIIRCFDDFFLTAGTLEEMEDDE